MRKKILILGIIAVSIPVVYLTLNHFLGKDSHASTLWHQFSRRLFDDDLPKEKVPKSREFDMIDM